MTTGKKKVDFGVMSLTYDQWENSFPETEELGLLCFSAEFVTLPGVHFFDNLILMCQTKWTPDFKRHSA